MGFWSSISSGFKAVGGFVADHWKEIAVVAATTVIFAAALRGGATTLLASEGVRVIANRFVPSGTRNQQVGARGREILPEPEPVLTEEQAAAQSRAAAEAKARELRSPDGEALPRKDLDG